MTATARRAAAMPPTLTLTEATVTVTLRDAALFEAPWIGDPLTSPGAATAVAVDVIGRRATESVLCLFLDARYRVSGYAEVARGTLNSASLRPRDVLTPALLSGAAAVIIAHNHPSGETSPSRADRLVTTALRDACRLVGVVLLDHVIVTATGASYSFRAAEGWEERS